MFLSETLDAEAALAAGLIYKVVAADALAASTAELATKLANGPTQAYGNYKRLVEKTCDRSLPEQLEAERNAFSANTRTADFREGVSAFLGKRAAPFKGRVE